MNIVFCTHCFNYCTIPVANVFDLWSNRDCWHEFCQSLVTITTSYFRRFVRAIDCWRGVMVKGWKGFVLVLKWSFRKVLLFFHGVLGFCMSI